jgi:hypothetical protein
VPVSSQESELSCICVFGVSILPLSMNLIFDCLFANSGVQHILCCVFVLFVFVLCLCTLCCLFLCVVFCLSSSCACVPYVASFFVLCTLCCQFLRLVSCVPYVASFFVLCTLCCQFLRLVYPMLPISLDFPFMIAPSVFYLTRKFLMECLH